MACAVLGLWSLRLNDKVLAKMGFNGVVPMRKFKQVEQRSLAGGDFR